MGGEGVTRKKRIFYEKCWCDDYINSECWFILYFFDVKSTMSQPLALRIRWQ